MATIQLILFICFYFSWRDALLQLFYACLVSFLFVVYMIYNLGYTGKGKNRYSLDDVYVATLSLYLEAVNMFLCLPSLLS